jgi:WD40 repeat protein
VSNAVEIDIVPAEARPKASEREPAWGEQVENLQCRLRAEKATWTAGTVPKLFGDLRSYDMWQPDLSSVSEDWEIEIDGRWHKNQRAKLLGSHCYRMLFLSSLSAEHDAQEVVYQLAIDAEQTAARSLRALAPGKHVLRAGYQFDALPPDAAKVMSAVKEVLGPHGFSRSGKAVHVVSNPIEIEIVAAEAAAPSGVSGEVKLSPRKLMSTSVGKDMGVLAVAFSPSGKTLATVDEAGQVRLHNARAGTETLSFNLLTAQEREAIFRDARRQKILTGGIAFSPSGMVLAVGGGPVVKLYDVADGRLDLTFVDKRLVEAPSPPAPLPEGEGSRKPSLPALLPAGGARGESPSKPSAVPYAHGQVFCVAFSPDGTLLATSGDVVREVGEDTGATPGHLKLWNVKTGELKRDLGDYYPSVRSVAFSPDGKTLASVGTHPPDGTCSVRLWDPQTGTVKRVLRIDHGSIPWSVAFSPDGKLLAACALVNEDDRDGRLGERGCKLLAWNAQTGTPLCTRPAPGLAQLSFSADSKILAAGVDGRGVTLWDPETLTPKGEIQLSNDPPREVQVAFSPIGSLLAVGAKDAKQGGFITVWEIGRGEDHPE